MKALGIAAALWGIIGFVWFVWLCVRGGGDVDPAPSWWQIVLAGPLVWLLVAGLLLGLVVAWVIDVIKR